MYISMNRLHCPADYGEHLERAFKYAGNLDGVAGCVLFQFMKHIEEDGSLLYVALTQWKDRTSYEAWLKSESFNRAHGGGEASPVRATTETFEVLS